MSQKLTLLIYRAALLSGLLLVTACGRGEGPDEDEHGKLLFWLVNSATARQDKCTDNSAYTPLYPAVPNLRGNVAYYYIYMVGKNGRTAVGQDCDPENWNDCTPDPSLIFQINDHVLTATLTETLQSGRDCTVTKKYDIRAEDKGEELDGLDTVTFQLEGEGCDAFERNVQESSPNGFGLRECRATRTAHAVFSHSRDP